MILESQCVLITVIVNVYYGTALRLDIHILIIMIKMETNADICISCIVVYIVNSGICIVTGTLLRNGVNWCI